MDVFDVYVGRDGSEQWGLCRRGSQGRHREVRLARGEVVEDRQISGNAAAVRIGEILRKGFHFRSSDMYLDDESGRFTARHPDFPDDGWVLCAEVSDIPAALAELETMLRRALDPEVVTSWVRAADRNDSFLVAGVLHPAFAICIADYAVRHGLPLRSREQGMPRSSPLSEPDIWKQWLHARFSMDSIQEGLLALPPAQAAVQPTQGCQVLQLRPQSQTTLLDLL